MRPGRTAGGPVQVAGLSWAPECHKIPSKLHFLPVEGFCDSGLHLRIEQQPPCSACRCRGRKARHRRQAAEGPPRRRVLGVVGRHANLVLCAWKPSSGGTLQGSLLKFVLFKSCGGLVSLVLRLPCRLSRFGPQHRRGGWDRRDGGRVRGAEPTPRGVW